MVSKRWQLQNKLILHVILAAVCLLTSLSFYLPISIWQQIALVAIVNPIIFFVGRAVHRRYAKNMVRVFEMEFEDASYVVQRALNKVRMPFSKRTNKDGIVSFHLRQADVDLVIEAFPLNLPVDSHIQTVEASKLTFTRVGPENRQLIATLRQSLDEAFQYVIQRRETTIVSFGD